MKISTEPYRSEPGVLSRLRELSSRDRRAYVAVRVDFSSDYEIHAFRSPSAIPDSIIDLAIGCAVTNAIGYRGQLQGFTRAALVRERNRGFGCE